MCVAPEGGERFMLSTVGGISLPAKSGNGMAHVANAKSGQNGYMERY